MKTVMRKGLIRFLMLSALMALTLIQPVFAEECFGSTVSDGLVIGGVPASVAYNGGGKIVFSEDELKVWYGGTLLTKGKDYKTTYKNNSDVFVLEPGESFLSLSAGRKATAPLVKVTGIGSYKGSASRNFQITPLSIRDVRILSAPIFCVRESDAANSPAMRLQITFGNGKKYTLTEGKDYTLSFHRITRDETGAIEQVDLEKAAAGKKEPGEYLINAHGIGNFRGSLAEELSDAVRCPVLQVLSDAEGKTNPSLDKAVLLSKLPKQTFTLDPETSEPLVRSGEAISALKDGSIRVKLGDRVLVYGEDFIVEDPADTDASANRYPGGNNYITLLPGPAGTVTGSKRLKLTIQGTSMKTVRFENLASTVPYTGGKLLAYQYDGNSAPAVDNARTLKALARNAAQGAALVKKNGTKLSEKAFRITAKGDKGSPGIVKLTFTGLPKYGVIGSMTKKVKVTKRQLSLSEFEIGFREGVDPASVPFRKSGSRPEVLVRWTDPSGTRHLLTENSDYKVTYSSNGEVGARGTVSIKGKGAFRGSINNALSFTICEGLLSEAVTVTAADKVKKTNAKLGYYRSEPILSDGVKKLVLNRDYVYAEGGEPTYAVAADAVIDDVTYKAGTPIAADAYIPAGLSIRVEAAVLPKPGSGYILPQDEKSMSVEAVYHTGEMDLGKASAKICDLPFAGSGRAVIPEKSDFTALKVNGEKLSANDFEIISCKKNKKIGTASVLIHGLGRYCGTKECSFKITKGRLRKIAEDIPVDEGSGFTETVEPEKDTSCGDLETAGCVLTIEEGTFEKATSVSARPLDAEDMAAMGAMGKGRFERIISPMQYTCRGYDRSAFGGEVTLTLPLPDTEDLTRYVFVYFDEEAGELRYFYPDRYDVKNATMTLALPHFSSWWGGKLTKEEQIDAFLDEYCMQEAVSNGKYKNAASDLEPYLKKKAEALGLTKEAAADLIQAVINKTSGAFGGNNAGLVELGTQEATTLLRGVYDNNPDSITTGMSDVADAAIQKCWQELKFSERGLSVFTDEAIAGAAGNANALSRMIAHFSEGGESGFEDGMKELGNILQSIHPAAELTTKGARFLGSCANTSFVYWKASEVEELYRIYKNGCKDFWGNEVLPGDKESFLEYLNYSSGFTKAKGINRFYNMDKIEELYERLKFTEFKGKPFSQLSQSDRSKLEKYAEDGLMEYFELRRSQEKDADDIRQKEREIIETMLNSYYGALDSKHFNEFFGEESEEDYDITFRLQRLVNIRSFLSQYVDEAALERAWKDGGENWGDLMNEWVSYASDENNTRDMAIDEFIDYLEKAGLLKKGIKKKDSGGSDPDPDIKTGLEQVYDDDGVLMWETYYRNDGTKEWYKYYEGGKLKYHAEYDDDERVIHELHYDLKTEILQKEDFYEYDGNGELLKKLRRHYSLAGGGLLEEFEFTPATSEELELIGYEGKEKRYIAKRTLYYEQEGVVDPELLAVEAVRYAVYESVEMVHSDYDGYVSDYYGMTWYRYREDGTVERDRKGQGTVWTDTERWYPDNGGMLLHETADPGAEFGTVTFYWKGGGEKAVEYYAVSKDSTGAVLYQNFMTDSDYSLDIWTPLFDQPWYMWYADGTTASIITGTYAPLWDGYNCNLSRKDYNEAGTQMLSTTLDRITEDSGAYTEYLDAKYCGAKGDIIINYDSFRFDLTKTYFNSEVKGYSWTNGNPFESKSVSNGEIISHEYWRAWEGVNGEYKEWGWYYRDLVNGDNEETIRIGKEKLPSNGTSQ